MTIINGLPVSEELAEALKIFCTNTNNDADFLGFGIETISDIQDIVTEQIGGFSGEEKTKLSNMLSDIVAFKRGLKKLKSLLPQIDIE